VVRVRDLSIRSRLIGSFVVVVLLFAITGAFAIRGLRQVRSHYEDALRSYAARALVGAELKVALLEQVWAQKNYVLRDEPQYLEQAEQCGERVRAARTRLGSDLSSPDDEGLIETLDATLGALEEALETNIEVRRTQGIEAADRVMRGRAAAAIAAVDSIVLAAERRAAREEAEALSAAEHTRQLTVLLIASVGLLALGLAAATSLSITGPLRRLQSQIETMTREGTQPTDVAVAGRNEIAAIARAFVELLQKASLLRSMEARSKRLESLSSRISQAQEEERGRIARELHDGVGQALTAVKLDLRAADRRLPPGADKTREHIAKARDLIDGTLDGLHGLVFDLRPPALENLGLAAALESYARDFETRFGVTVEVKADRFEPRLPAEVETNLYRVFQEAMTNVAKHARARNVAVRLTDAAGQVNLVVTDDGVGFDTAALANSEGAAAGVGLLSMERRCEELGGSFEMQSGPQTGTSVRVSVPQHRENRHGTDHGSAS